MNTYETARNMVQLLLKGTQPITPELSTGQKVAKVGRKGFYKR